MNAVKHFLVASTFILYLSAYSQTDHGGQSISTNEAPKTLVAGNHKNNKGQEGAPANSPAPLPDLKIASHNATLVSSQLVDDIKKHTIQIGYAVKNDSTACLPTTTSDLQGSMDYDPSCRKLIFAGVRDVSPAAIPGINPGSSWQGSSGPPSSFNKKNQRMYMPFPDKANGVKELNEQNNPVQTTILF